MTATGHTDEGTAEMRRAMAPARASGSYQLQTFFLAKRAQPMGRVGAMPAGRSARFEMWVDYSSLFG